ncbi:MAG TPA: phosphotyrosine protein phosphatase [Candidatus Competibacter sp.]|nr:phosphotyrosine protein phosphatase [Candidatus Competibacter sp.]
MGLRSWPSTVLEWLIFRLRIGRFGGLPPRSAPRRLVFVCTGNICRSPYAEALAHSCGLEAVSAGIDTTPGLPAHPQAIAEARARGIDLSGHRTASWADVRLRNGDMVIAVELRHLLAVQRRVREAGCQIALMSSLSQDCFAIVRDPYGREPAVFQAVFDLIEKLLRDMQRNWHSDH